MKDHKIFCKEIELRVRDLNHTGHVANPVFFSYFDEGWAAFSSDVVKLNRYDLSVGVILANINCTFLKPIFLGNRVVLQIWIGNMGVKSFTLRLRLVDRENQKIVFAEADAIYSCYNYQEKKSIQIPENVARIFQEYSDTISDKN